MAATEAVSALCPSVIRALLTGRMLNKTKITRMTPIKTNIPLSSRLTMNLRISMLNENTILIHRLLANVCNAICLPPLRF